MPKTQPRFTTARIDLFCRMRLTSVLSVDDLEHLRVWLGQCLTQRQFPSASGRTCCAIPSPHTFWKTATCIRVIQVLLGHAKLDTTALYAKVAVRMVRAVVSPLDRLALFHREEASPG